MREYTTRTQPQGKRRERERERLGFLFPQFTFRQNFVARVLRGCTIARAMPVLAQEQQQQTEVMVVGSVAAAVVPALLTRLRALCVGGERELSSWDRTLQSTLPAENKELRECRLHTDLHQRTNVLRVEAQDRLTVSHVAKARAQPCVQARNVSHVPVGASAEEFMGTLRFAQTHEVLRRGQSFRHGSVLVSVYQICTRPSAKDEWVVLDEHGLWMAEAVALGEQLQPLVAEIDEWADTFETTNVCLL